MNAIISIIVGLFAVNTYAGPGGHHSHHGGHDNMMGDGHWMAPDKAQKVKNPVFATAASVAAGKKHYQTLCAACHGTTGKGDGPAGKSLNPLPTDLSIMAHMHPEGDLAWKIKNGKGAMPAWKGTLSDKDIWNVINYMKTFK